MFSNIKNLIISDKLITINHEQFKSTVSLTSFFSQSLKNQSEDKQLLLELGHILRFNSEEKKIEILGTDHVISFFAPREIRYCISKDLGNTDTDFMFNLNYRKHFRLKYSKSHANIQYFNFEYPEMLKNKRLIQDIQSFYAMGKSYSEGESHRPTLMIVANILDDAADYVKFDVSFRIIKGNKLVHKSVRESYKSNLE